MKDEGGEGMSKTIIKYLEDKTVKLLENKQALINSNQNSYVIESEMKQFIDSACHPMINKRINELIRISAKLTEQKNAVQVKILRAMEEHKAPDPDYEQERDFLEIQISIVDRSIEKKREYQRTFTHQVDRNLIEHPFISSTQPNEKTLEKMRDKGIIKMEKTGFRKLYYQNENGYLLVPYDSRVLIGLFKLWEVKGKSAQFTFEFRELLHTIYADINGGEYTQIHKSLQNLATTSIIMEEYLDPESGKRTRTRIHNPITDADIDRVNNKATIAFNSYLHKSLIVGNVVKISMALFNDLASPISKTLYLLLANKIKDNETILDYSKLVNHLDLHSYESYKANNLVKSSLEELKSFDFIKNFTIIKEGRSYSKILFEPSDWVRDIDVEEHASLSLGHL
ncbi:RepB family plasmid replication initiator protein [Paenibacillus solisilvae]|uniref:RepB family plasmid replication initiator protein n=1 Tax=Paenibacillus solisilvae TaxID=2486751 RepID=A0ABW0W1S6_9BACL